MKKRKRLYILSGLVMFLCMGTIYSWSVFRGPLIKELELISKLIDKTSLVILHDLMGCKSEPNYFNPIHDTEPSSEWMLGGPYRAVNELSEDWEWMTIPVNNGLTLLRRKV